MRIEDLMKGNVRVEIRTTSKYLEDGVIIDYNTESITLKKSVCSSEYKPECIIMKCNIEIINIMA